MSDLTVSVGDAFDGMGLPVLLLRGHLIVYQNSAAARLLAGSGAGEELPACLDGLPERGSSAVTLGDRAWTAQTWPGEAGTFVCLSPLDDASILPDRRIPLLTQKLRGPLAVLISSGHLLEQTLTPAQAADAAGYLARMTKSELRFLRILRTLELAALPDGEAPYDFTPRVVDLGGLLHEALRQLEMPVQATGCSIAVHQQAGNFFARCDDQLLLIQLYHLVSNSLAALAPGGGRITLRLERRREMALLSVEDDGPGMDEEKLSALFQPAEGNDSLREARHGLGLGVTVCRKIAQLHGGSVLFTSQPGRGTRACVSLPLVKPGPVLELRGLRAVDTSNGVPLVLRELSDVLPERLFRSEESQ